MKKRAIEAIAPKRTKKMGWWTTVQILGKIVILDVYQDGCYQARHCINVKTKEFATNKHGLWTETKVENAYGRKPDTYYYYCTDSELKNRCKMAKEDEETLRAILKETLSYCYRKDESVAENISRLERERGREQREATETRRVDRVNAMMARIPAVPAGIKEWIDQKAMGKMNFCMKDRETKLWSCTACGEEFEEKQRKTESGAAPRNNDMVICPKCGEKIKLLTRKKIVEMKAHFCMIQPIDDEVSTVRHFTATIECAPGEKKGLGIEEDVRFILDKKWTPIKGKAPCDIYYEQYRRSNWVPDGGIFMNGSFDNKHNPSNKREYSGYLYDGGIEEALAGTAYHKMARLFTQMSAAGAKLNYNFVMMLYREDNYIRIMELLFKGRFHRLLEEESENVGCWTKAYCGKLRLWGATIEDVFGIGDRQKINRIREHNGGELMMSWMRWSDEQDQKISEKALNWIMKNGLKPKDMEDTLEIFSLEQGMNYIERQNREQYKNISIRQTVKQYEDYIDMCAKLGKDLMDEMVFRPRELKRRHDEAVEEIERRSAEIKAEEYSKKFGKAEQVLQEIKEKFEYAGENYFIKVPERIADIVAEGNYLHHCAGATDRYFDRIKQHETYICFMRKTEEPDMPYYTVEVEPGGTIRQHRGMYDEEPEIELVKPFLKEWQLEIRKRMKEEDHKKAAESKKKREENLEELRQKNNVRVLNGLMEDFMEAEAM